MYTSLIASPLSTNQHHFCIKHSGTQPNLFPAVQVYKTSVQTSIQANRLKTLLLEHFPGSKINFDLEDCDNILRIETTVMLPRLVIDLVVAAGFACEELPD